MVGLIVLLWAFYYRGYCCMLVMLWLCMVVMVEVVAVMMYKYWW